GLVALGIMFLSWRILPRSAGERALIISQAYSIVDRSPMGEAPIASAGSGIYAGLGAAVAIAAFGLIIVIRRVAPAYALHAVHVVENARPPANVALGWLPKVTGITVNTVHGRTSTIAAVVARCRPQVESMEGAAFMYACRLAAVPYAQVRAVSNVVERRNRAT